MANKGLNFYWFLVFKGGGFDFITASEVLDLESDIADDCNDWTEFPIEITSGTGALFNIDSDKGTEGIF